MRYSTKISWNVATALDLVNGRCVISLNRQGVKVKIARSRQADQLEGEQHLIIGREPYSNVTVHVKKAQVYFCSEYHRLAYMGRPLDTSG